MAAYQKTCALPGCSKCHLPSLDPSKPHLTCGDLHHQLLMASRFHPDVSDPAHQQIFDRNKAGLCALHHCSEPPGADDSWCSAAHCLLWLTDFSSRLCSDQICKLPGCIRHVYVDDKLSRSEYCGWRHRQKDVMRSAMQHRRQQLPQQGGYLSPSVCVERRNGIACSVESLMICLSDYVHSGVTPTDIKVDNDFFNKHPWDVCRDGDMTWLITSLKYTTKMRVIRITKDSYHWKQQGPSVPKSSYVIKYFTYRKLKGNNVQNTYFMEEYTANNIQRFAVLRLHSSGVCHRKDSKGLKQHGAQVVIDNPQSQNSASQTKDEMDAGGLIWDCLSPLNNSGVILDCSWDHISE